MKFLRLNINDDYNHDMGGCDIAAQLCNYYWFDHWMRKRKWWWSFFFWAIGVLLVNTYVTYKTYMLSKGKIPITHYKFREAITLAWIDPKTHWPNRMKTRNNKQTSATSTAENLSSLRLTGITTRKKNTTMMNDENSQMTRTSGRSRRNGESMVGSVGEPSRSTKRTKRAAPVTDTTLCPRTGIFCKLLDMCHGAHMPQPSEGTDPKCALHNWGARQRK